MVAHINGNVLNMSNLSKSLELTSTTIKKYLSFLEQAFLIRQLQPYSVNIKKRLVKSPKIYVRDSGILHHLIGIEDLNSLSGNPILVLLNKLFRLQEMNMNRIFIEHMKELNVI